MNSDEAIDQLIKGIKATDNPMASKRMFIEGETYYLSVMTEELYLEINKLMVTDPRSITGDDSDDRS